MKLIRLEAAEFLLSVKGFRPSTETAQLERSDADLQLGGHSYFVGLANDFQAFRETNPNDSQSHPEQGAIHAIFYCFSMTHEMQMACGGRLGAVPESFRAMNEESLGRVINFLAKAMHSHATFGAPNYRQRDRGAARGRKQREAADQLWADRLLKALSRECATGRIEISRAGLLERVVARLQDEEPDLSLPGDAAVLARMAEWELKGKYVRYEPGSGRPSFIPK
jgi:hypothetical protein